MVIIGNFLFNISALGREFENFFNEDYLNIELKEFPNLADSQDSILHKGSTDFKYASKRGDFLQKKYINFVKNPIISLTLAILSAL